MNALKNRKLVIQAILLAQKQDSKSPLKLNINSKNKLNTLTKQEISDILYDLECKEWVIRSRSDKQSSDFNITILQDLENWYDAYCIRIKRKLKNLPKESIIDLSDLTKQISETFQIRNSPDVLIYSDQNHSKSLEFLYDQSILISYINTDIEPAPGFKIKMTLNVKKFLKFETEIKRIVQKKTSLINKDSKIKEAVNKILYKITFSSSNEVLLNERKVLSKPYLNSENSNVFGYLMKHPNKPIEKNRIEKAIGKRIGKDFHKIIENLGFKETLRKVFFTISKDTIVFRNPITKSQFEKFKVPPLRINKK